MRPQRPKTAKASARKRSTKQAEDGEFATMKIKELLKDAGLDHTVLDPKPESVSCCFSELELDVPRGEARAVLQVLRLEIAKEER